jgi:hypothetical protein
VLCAGIVLPHPPLLVPEVASGAAAELADLRAACSLALQAGLGERPDRVVLLGTVPGAADATGAPTLAPYGLPGPPVGLPLPFTIGSWLLDRAGWTGPRTIVPVSVEARPPECAALGTRLAGEPGRCRLPC